MAWITQVFVITILVTPSSVVPRLVGAVKFGLSLADSPNFLHTAHRLLCLRQDLKAAALITLFL